MIRFSSFFHQFLIFGAAQSAHEIDDEADQQNQAKSAAANDRTTEVKSTASEQKKQNN
jgi:hypothetical protein